MGSLFDSKKEEQPPMTAEDALLSVFPKNIPDAGPAEATAVLTDFGSRVQQLSDEERGKATRAIESLNRERTAFEAGQAGIALQQEGERELRDLKANDGIVAGLFNLFTRPGKALRDEVGITERRANSKVLLGKQMTANALARFQHDEAVAAQQAEVAEAVGRFRKGVVTEAQSVFDVQKDIKAQRQKDVELQISQSRLIHDQTKFAAERRKEAVANIVDSGSSTELFQLAESAADSPDGRITLFDPISNAEVTVPVSYFAEQAKKKSLLEAQNEAAFALAQLGKIDSQLAIDRASLGLMETSSLRKLVGSSGAYSYKDPVTGEEKVRQFNLDDVGAILQKREELAPIIVAAQQAGEAEAYAAQAAALPQGASAEDFAQIEQPPVVAQSLESMANMDRTMQRVVDITNDLFIDSNGELPLDVKTAINSLRREQAELGQLRTGVITGAYAMTDANKAALDKVEEKFDSQLLGSIEKIAKGVAGGNKDLEAFVASTLRGAQSSPEVVMDTFISIANQPDAGFNAQASEATRTAMDRYNENRARIVKEEIEKLGGVVAEDQLSDIQRTLAAFNTNQSRNKAPTIGKQEAREIDRRAIAIARGAQRDKMRDAILAGDIRSFDPQSIGELKDHAFLRIPDLSKFEAIALNRTELELNARGLRADSKSKEAKDEYRRLKPEVYYNEYAKLLTESQVEGFDNGADALYDFVTQPAFSRAVNRLARGDSGTGIADRVSAQLFGPTTARTLADDLTRVVNAARTVQATAIESSAKIRQAYRNDGMKRLEAVLQAMPNDVIGDQDATALAAAVRQRVNRLNADGRNPQSRTNNAIENIILHQKFDQPEIEAIRKRVAKEWSTASSYADRIFFIDKQEVRR